MTHILLAYDATPPARRALDTAAELAKRLEADVTVVSVVPLHPGRWGVDPWDGQDVHAGALGEARTLLAQQGIEPRLLEPIGDPARTIERIAAEEDFDYVVVGSRELSGLTRLLAGSVSEHVAAHAPATVVVAR